MKTGLIRRSLKCLVGPDGKLKRVDSMLAQMVNFGPSSWSVFGI